MLAAPSGVPLLRHTVFFSADYAAEFDDILLRRRVPARPTVYVCAGDRDADERAAPCSPERLFCVVNAPATGDIDRFDPQEMQRCSDSLFASLAACGLQMATDRSAMTIATPADFAEAYPATGGAIYGRASHGWMVSFQRAATRSAVPGLYFAGGSTHPGAGLPMAALSGRLAASALRADWASQGKWRPAVMSGGMSTA
jgi:1-hydroxycarotenoid 3,4-desaturase